MKTIKSSEVASYLFCPVCWWNERINGVKITKVMSRGESYHNIIAENQSKAKLLYVCMVIVAIVGLVLIIYRFLR